MLLVGLTGGIASGKSTVAGWLRDQGAVVIDADVLAREALARGSAGLDAVVQRFGAHLLTSEGALDRSALAAVIFDDDDARADLEAIVHPAVERGFAARLAQAPSDAIVIYDVPLLVENALADRYHLVLVTQAPRELRIERAMTRGMTRTQVEARIETQATDEDRRAAADIVISTAREEADVRADVARLWSERLIPYQANLAAGRRAERSKADLSSDDPANPWADQARRLLDRLVRAGGSLIHDAAHIGSTAIPGLVAKDVLDLQVGVRTLADADALAPLLAAAGFPRVQDRAQDTPKAGTPDPELWTKTFHANADPGRAVNLHVRVAGSPGWEWALAFRDWLCSDAAARAGYAALKQGVLADVAEELSATSPTFAYAEAKEPWFSAVADPQIAAWKARTLWSATDSERHRPEEILRPELPQG